MELTGPAWASLVLIADLAGMKAPASRPAPVRVDAVSIAEVRAAQDAAYSSAGAVGVETRAAFDPAGGLWLKLRRSTWEAAVPFKDGSRELDTPLGRLRVEVGGGAATLSLGGRSAVVRSGALLDAAYAANRRATFGPITYAAFHEDGASVPAGVAMLRRGQDGVYWVAHRALGDMSRMQWLLSVNGTMYGMRLDGAELAFYAQPTPGVGAAQPPSPPRR